MRLKDKVAIVTGGASGIGLATVKAFVREGATVAFWDVSPKGAAVAEELTKLGGRVSFTQVNVVDKNQVLTATEATARKFGRVDILINNAGITKDRTPFGTSPAFRIPRAEPLKIYLSWNGSLAAHGTVEANFADGATVRGSVSWREPNFEVRFQGRNIVIPALVSLKRALPANPELCIPAGNSVAELDAAAKCLISFRGTYRALAMGGLAESSVTGGIALAPLGVPADSVGTALGAWASRLASWIADRAGQTLDAEMIGDLQKVVLNAAKTGESAHDLPTVLKLLRDVMVLRQHGDAPLGTGVSASELRARFQDAESRLLAAAERIIGETAGFEATSEFAEIVRLLGSATVVESTSGGGFRAAGGGSTRLQQLVAAAKAKIGPKFAGRVSTAALNQGLGSLSARDLLNFLEEMAVYRDLVLFSGGDRKSVV